MVSAILLRTQKGRLGFACELKVRVHIWLPLRAQATRVAVFGTQCAVRLILYT